MASFKLFAPSPSSVNLIGCSPLSWMVHLALREKGAQFTVEELDFAADEHRSPEMKARNPRGTVPCLEYGAGVDAVVMTESMAMLLFVDEVAPAPAMMPERSSPASAIAHERFFAAAGLKGAGAQLFRYLAFTPVEQRDTIRVDAMLSSLHGELARAESWFGGDDESVPRFCAGRQLTLVDLVVFVYVATAIQLGLNCRTRYPGLHRLYESLRGRPSVRATWPGGWRAPLDLLS
ncbi:MAG: glutathione S-transferase family protein [Myxococcota bacterium]